MSDPLVGIVTESGKMPLKDPQMELFARKICEGMNPSEAYRLVTGKSTIEEETAEKGGRRWMRDCKARITHINNERAKNFIKADDEIRAIREKAALTRSKRTHVDVSTFEGRQRFFQDVCDDYQFNDGVEVSEAINAVKELMKINGDFDRREDEVAKTDPAMVMAVIARAHIKSPTSQGAGVLDVIGAKQIADAIREYFNLDYVRIAGVKAKIDCESRSKAMEDIMAEEVKPSPAPAQAVAKRLEL